VADGPAPELELAKFLRARRERLDPAQLGFPAAGRRRTPGLRREEVAVLAGVSTTWYTYLEQGRGKEVSPAVLDSIAQVLQLTEDERRHLHVLAYGKVITPRPLTGELPGDELVRLLVLSVAQSPFPVYGANLYCDLIAWNRAAVEWYDDWGKLPVRDRNMVRWLITSSAARERIEGWEDEVRDVVARWRAMTSPWLTDNRLQDLITEFRVLSDDFVRCWDEHEVREHRSRSREFLHPRLGRRRMRAIIVESPEFTPSFVVFHVPES
jgi:transcriptional regulator with XRE-family HTH domain